MDAGLAKVLNSTVGTSTMKSLDKVLLDNVKLIGSDEVLLVYDGGWTYQAIEGTGYNISSKKIEFQAEGSVIFKGLIKNITNGTNTWSMSVRNTNQGVLDIETVTIPGQTQVELSFPLNVTKGQQVTIWFSGTNMGMDNVTVTACATPRLTGGTCKLV